MPSQDLRARLQRLRPHKVTVVPPAPPAEAALPGPAASAYTAPSGGLPGVLVDTALGAFQLIETRYAFDFSHGPKRLGDLFGYDAATAARLARDEALAQADLRSLAFIDTETTGLAGGAGTLVFLIGVGTWQGDDFVLRQYFLQDPGQEPALLTQLVADLVPCTGWVTFNGRAFDLPLLEMRLTVNRQRGALGQRPHLDLLMPARRLYRGRLDSCSLGHLERHVFQIHRDDDDVPGWLIPQLYREYLQTGDARQMTRVIYHNTVDILSMVTLAAHLLEVFSPGVAPVARSAEDCLRLALWHVDNGRPVEAEAAFHEALAGRLRLEDRRLGLLRLAQLFKRQERRAEAAPLWEQLASFSLDDVEPFVELAKHFEWQAPDLPKALAWTERALKATASWPRGWQREAAAEALQHRLERLQRKQAARP